MPPIKVKRVVSCSSEDKIHNAENLLVSDRYRKWKSGQSGEKQVSVVLQLDTFSPIHSIDIGNEGSAFVEVLVGRSSDSTPSYEVLLVSSSFMAPLESRQGTNTNRVRMFGTDKLSLTTSKEKWDLVKIVCTQPFNKTTQYGLSFIAFHSPPDKTDVESETSETQKSIGAFKMKSDDDDGNKISVGSWFAKRKSDSQDVDPLSNPSAIKSATVKQSNNISSASTKVVKSAFDDSNSKTTKNGILSKFDDVNPNHNKKPKLTPNSKSSSSAQSNSPKPTVQASSKKVDTKRVSQSVGNSSSSRKPKKRAKNVRPFHKLLEGTIFVLSGYQNPQRSQIRDKAVEMGAVYKPDWDKQSTHLICAFQNTPKFQEVQRKGGRIVREKWILECYNQKKLLPWRQFLLGKSNRPLTSESEGCSSTEDETEEPQQKPDLVQKSSKFPVPDPEQSNTDSEHENVYNKADRPVSRSSVESTQSLGDDINSDAIYGADTDVDTDSGCDTESEINKVLSKTKGSVSHDKPDTSILCLPPLPDIFQGKHFYLYGAFDNSEKKDLVRYIVGCGGAIDAYMNDKIVYVLTHSKWNKEFTDTITDNPTVRILKPSWVIKCVECGKLLPKADYFVSKR